MFARLAVVLLLGSATISIAWTHPSFSFFPVMAPLAVLLVMGGGRARADLISTSFVGVAIAATLSAVLTGAQPGYAILWVTVASLYLTSRYRIQAYASEVMIARTISSLIVIVCGIAFYQFATTSTAGSPYNNFSTNMRLGLASVDGELVQRPVGVFHNSNILGQWLVFAGLLLLPLYRNLARPTRFVVFCMATGVLAITFSRGVWAIVAAAAIVSIARWTGRSLARVAGACMAGAAAIGLALAFNGQNFLQQLLPDRLTAENTQRNISERELLNEYGWEVASAHPLSGVGYFQYSGFGGSGVESLRPHNVFIQVAAEQGLFTAAALLLAFAAVAITCWRTAIQSSWNLRLSASLGVLPVAWFGFLMLYSSAAEYAVMPIFAIACGYLLSSATRRPPDGRAPNRARWAVPAIQRPRPLVSDVRN